MGVSLDKRNISIISDKSNMVGTYQSSSSACQEPVALMSTPSNIVNISVVWKKLEELLGVHTIIGGEGRETNIPQGDYTVIGSTEQPGRLAIIHLRWLIILAILKMP